MFSGAGSGERGADKSNPLGSLFSATLLLVTDESIEHEIDPINAASEVRDCLWRKLSDLLRYHKQSVQFTKRSPGNRIETRHLARRTASCTFCDIGWHADSGPRQL